MFRADALVKLIERVHCSFREGKPIGIADASGMIKDKLFNACRCLRGPVEQFVATK